MHATPHALGLTQSATRIPAILNAVNYQHASSYSRWLPTWARRCSSHLLSLHSSPLACLSWPSVPRGERETCILGGFHENTNRNHAARGGRVGFGSGAPCAGSR